MNNKVYIFCIGFIVYKLYMDIMNDWYELSEVNPIVPRTYL